MVSSHRILGALCSSVGSVLCCANSSWLACLAPQLCILRGKQFLRWTLPCSSSLSQELRTPKMRELKALMGFVISFPLLRSHCPSFWCPMSCKLSFHLCLSLNKCISCSGLVSLTISRNHYLMTFPSIYFWFINSFSLFLHYLLLILFSSNITPSFSSVSI